MSRSRLGGLQAPGRSRSAAYALIAPALGLLLALAVLPVLLSLVASFTHDLGFERRTFAGLGNYRELAADPESREAMLFTALFVLVSVPLELGLGLLFALALHRAFRWRGWIRAAVLVPWAIPTVVTAWMWTSIFDGDRGLLNRLLFGSDLAAYTSWLADPLAARAAIVVADVWKTTPFVALVLLAGLQGIPQDLWDAARLDGAGAMRRFVFITLPLLRPALLIAVLFRTIDACRVFDLVYVMTKARAGTSVLQYLGYQKLLIESNIGVGSAIATVVFAAIAAISIVLVRAIGPAFWREEA